MTSDGKVVEATHDNVARSPEALLQAATFLKGWLAGTTPVIVDPYAELGTAAL